MFSDLQGKVQFGGGGTDMFSDLQGYISQFLEKSKNCVISRNSEKKSQNCEIKSHNNLLYFLFSGGNGFHNVQLMFFLYQILSIRILWVI